MFITVLSTKANLETTQMPNEGWIDQEVVTYTDNGIVYRSFKKGIKPCNLLQHRERSKVIILSKNRRIRMHTR